MVFPHLFFHFPLSVEFPTYSIPKDRIPLSATEHTIEFLNKQALTNNDLRRHPREHLHSLLYDGGQSSLYVGVTESGWQLRDMQLILNIANKNEKVKLISQ